jgi:hypothetical protein
MSPHARTAAAVGMTRPHDAVQALLESSSTCVARPVTAAARMTHADDAVAFAECGRAEGAGRITLAILQALHDKWHKRKSEA